jgi:hypothetical protein
MTPNSSLSLLHAFNNCVVYSKFPHSCIFLRMCNAYEIGLLVLIYLICSLCLISINLPLWPTYALLHILHCNLYIPLEFILFCGVLLHNWLHIVLHIQKDMFKSVLLNKLVILCLSEL